jgi:hypothetical protein
VNLAAEVAVMRNGNDGVSTWLRRHPNELPQRRVEEWLAVPLVLLADGDGWSYSFSTQ